MSSSGSSQTPLPKKLGIKETSRLLVVNAPDSLWGLPGALPPAVRVRENVAAAADVMIVFVTRAADLSRWLAALGPRLESGNRLWIAWPKKASKLATDLNFDRVQS